jgi:hypothetical protein
MCNKKGWAGWSSEVCFHLQFIRSESRASIGVRPAGRSGAGQTRYNKCNLISENEKAPAGVKSVVVAAAVVVSLPVSLLCCCRRPGRLEMQIERDRAIRRSRVIMSDL